MISKRKLKERLLDICNGAGYVWIEEDKCFEPQDGSLPDGGRTMAAIMRALELPDSSRLKRPWHLSDFDDIDAMVDLVHGALEFDIKD